jgi:hypothetical protein
MTPILGAPVGKLRGSRVTGHSCRMGVCGGVFKTYLIRLRARREKPTGYFQNNFMDADGRRVSGRNGRPGVKRDFW